jgi:hypothetical protein
MDIVTSRIRLVLMAAMLSGATSVGLGCGGADGDEPTISGIGVECEDSGDADVGQVVSAVTADVDDPDRDLVGVEGRVNGIQITMTDDDADREFTWSPPSSSEPLACTGDFFVQITAVDKAGNSSTKSAVVEK